MKLRKINRVIHRDFGYFFSGMILIYALSGIAINHKHDWNPNYIIDAKSLYYKLPEETSLKSQNTIDNLLAKAQPEEKYKKHYFPNKETIKIFLNEGSVISYNSSSETLLYEQIKKRPLFYSINFLHYNPGKLWKWFSDIFAIGLILLTISGAFILKGKNGIRFRGAILISAGIILPIIILFMY